MSRTITKSTLSPADPQPAENHFAPGRLVINKSEGPRRVILVCHPSRDHDRTNGREFFKGTVVYTDTDTAWATDVGGTGLFLKDDFKPFEGTVSIEQYRDTFSP